jgi:bifunctional DNA-binding transcriptional regulator/antitoxin component of YhaV-PrlF toxin-antitoxin module
MTRYDLDRPILGHIGNLPSGGRVASVESFKVSSSGQMSLPAAVRHRWRLDQGGRVDVLDLGFGVLTVPEGHAARLLDEILPAEAHYEAVAAEEDPDLISR